MSPASPYSHRVVCALNEVVVPLHFYACTSASAQEGRETITIFGVAPDGTLRGGYELGYDHTERDIFDDTLRLASFFLQALTRGEVLFQPPTVQERWYASGLENETVDKAGEAGDNF
jgi:hypothetical protein